MLLQLYSLETQYLVQIKFLITSWNCLLEIQIIKKQISPLY